MRLLLLFVGFLVLSSQLQHIHASRHYSSPLPSNPASNEEEIVHEGNMEKEETQIQEKDVTVANKLGGGSFRSGGGGFRGGGGFSSRGSGSYYRGSGSRGSSGSGLRGSGVGFGLGYIFGHHHHHHHSGGVSSLCINPFFQFLVTIIVLAKLILGS
ncbi:hypothetical protein POM88_028864 [Heracleum sosnowskyi]|uniref:Glycine-rich protein n=1 Tax=Heracleum sosnowskyi TaxID=360622 RepID=A0AAD8HTN7_9APIA|nr:hypothetical protein POM88_028864 [Heracleum sosnowskyi]